jgi:type II secretory pathway pseudopilin PulG
MKNNKGFVMLETIIVISILSLGLISLYSSYVLILRKASTTSSDSSLDTYIAYQIDNYKSFKNYSITDGYTEIFKKEDTYYLRYCSKTTATCSGNYSLSTEESKIYSNLGIEKIYYTTNNISDLLESKLLLTFDGSTINYLQSIKNDEEINDSAEHTIIVKMQNTGNGSSFSYYQKEYDNETNFLRGLILGEDKSNVSSTLTKPGKEISLASEAVLSSTEDDYGTSYYFRGAVENNYVIFANMCWRIIRITGNGAIKLTLYNYNGDNATNPCNVVGTSLAFARYSGTTYTSAFNSTITSNTYIGYMYGKADSSTYEAEHENLYDSTILTNLKTWYDANFSDTEKSLMADTIWCNDKRLSSNSYTGVGTSTSYYAAAAYDRLRSISTASPSLKCGDSIDNNKISKFTASDTENGNGALNGYKIGLLTADETAFAGLIFAENGIENKTYYLYKNASSIQWWTLSPSYFGSLACLWAVDTGGSLFFRYVATNGYGVRPAISLKSTIVVTGTGTAEDPYVVIE